jgi:hypothetical protein
MADIANEEGKDRAADWVRKLGKKERETEGGYLVK